MQIPYSKRTLSNGLDVIVHEDHQLPMVAVNIWYHVGSKNERPGRTGFAHLFEHLMFEGSEHHDHGYFPPLQRAGGLLNGSTSTDRTNYWEVVPTGALDLALWMESDRMGYLLPALTEKKFNNQRDVVINERRQNYENRPYGLAGIALSSAMFPPDHPYHWPTIGFADDLRAASLDQVRDFFQTYYHPANASLSLAGDLETGRGLRAGRAVLRRPRAPDRLSRRSARRRHCRTSADLLLEDRVELPRLYLSWHSPAMFAHDDAELDVAADVLAHGKTSRLYKTLVYERRVATDVSAYQQSREMGGVFQIACTAAAGVSLTELEAASRAAVAQLASDGVTDAELERALAQTEAQFIYRLQTIGGFGGKCDQLNAYNTFVGDPGYFERDRQRYVNVTSNGVAAAVVEVARHGAVGVAERGAARPARAGAAGRRRGARLVSRVDRSRLPVPGADRPFRFPRIVRRMLPNGLELRAVTHRAVPVVSMVLLVPGGSSVDPADAFGLVSITAGLLDEGSRGQSALDIADRVARIGGELDLEVGVDAVVVGLTTLDRFLDTGLALVHEIVTAPNLANDDFNRIRNLRLERLRQTEGPRRRDGRARVCARALRRASLRASLARLRGVADAHDRRRRASAARRDVHARRLDADRGRRSRRGRVARRGGAVFDSWRAAGLADDDRSRRRAGAAAGGARLTFGVVSRPGAAQSELRIGHVCAPRSTPDYHVLLILNTILGGDFVSRLNLNLREQQGLHLRRAHRVQPAPRHRPVRDADQRRHRRHRAGDPRGVARDPRHRRGAARDTATKWRWRLHP